eukprot:2622588-Pleurochrysis_carterae.AAC.1
MRRAGAALGVLQFAGAEARRGEAESMAEAALSRHATLASASSACRQRALPFASVVNATSLPP